MTPPRRRRVLAASAGVVLVLAAGMGTWWSTRLDRTDPVATGQQFMREAAAGDERACELASPRLRTRLDTSCTGPASTATPQVRVLFSRTCGDRTLLGAAVTPAGPSGKPYALVGLGLDDQGRWQADSLLWLSERAAVRPGVCLGDDTDGGGR